MAQIRSDVRRMNSGLNRFEGMWLASPSGNIICCKVVGGRLAIPFSISEHRSIAGHFYDAKVRGDTLWARYEWFGKNKAGLIVLNLVGDFTLSGGFWGQKDVSPAVLQDITRADESMAGMKKTSWVLMPKAKTPAWASHYFMEWSVDI